MANQVTLTFAGDSKSLEKTFDRVGAGAKDMAKDMDKAGADAKKFGSAMDRAADATDASEGKFMGAADLLDGLGGAFGLPTEGATNLMRSFGDLSGGFTAIGPMIGKVVARLGAMVGITTTQAAATTGAATAQWNLNAAMTANPVGLIIAGIVALGAAVFLLWNKVDGFRDAIKKAWHIVEAGMPPLRLLGDAIGWVTGLFKNHDEKIVDTTDAYRIMSEGLKTLLDAQQTKWQQWRDKVTGLIDDIHNPLERAREKSTVTFEDIRKNLEDNVKFFDGWVANLQRLTARGFGALAQKMYELGPTAEKAVGEMISKTDRQLINMTNLFGTAGNQANKAFMNPFMTNESLRAIDGVGVQYGHTFKRGFDAGLAGPINIPVHRVGPAVPHLAEGGIVNRPTLAMIGESGPEAVVPLNRGGSATGGGITIQAGAIVTETQLADLVHKALLRKQQRGGSLGFA